MLKIIDNFLNRITMYKLVLYYLIAILLGAIFFSLIGVSSYSFWGLVFSISFITTICLLVNIVFGKVYKVPTNAESVYITALTLVCLITPISSPADKDFFVIAIWASILGIASKYILAIGKKHIFNPAAIGVALTSIFLGLSPSWWVGSIYLFPIILVGGFLVARKISREDLIYTFVGVAGAITLFSFISEGVDWVSALKMTFVASYIPFFAFLMFSEPLTTPPTRRWRVAYAVFTGLLFWPGLNIAGFYFTPAIALCIGNVFSYLASPKQKLVLTLKKKIVFGEDIYHFIFSSDKKLNFTPGQYLEWTIDSNKIDSRGNRRYFTIASSPTESEIGLGVKFYPKSSTFKEDLLHLPLGGKIVGAQLAGDFTLPEDKSKKLVFISGGIGVTPFRSMIKDLADRNEKRDIVNFYSNKFSQNIAYRDVFDEAVHKIGVKTVYLVTDKTDPNYTGRLDEKLIKSEAQDYADRTYYLSGPRNLIVAFEETLKNLGIKNHQIKTDFFPGFV